MFAKDQRTPDFQPSDWPSFVNNDIERGDLCNTQDKLPEFLEQLERVSRSSRRRDLERGITFRIWKQRRKLFSTESIMHDTLMGEPDIGGHQRDLTALACQNSCLVYLGLAFLDYADQPEIEEQFLSVVEAMINSELSKGLSPEHLLARLLMGLIDEDAFFGGKRAENVMASMLELKRLDADVCSEVQKRIWDCLSLWSGD